MEERLSKYFELFFKHCYHRLDSGEEMYGERYKDLDLYEQMAEELVDLANYAILQYVKIMELKKKNSSL